MENNYTQQVIKETESICPECDIEMEVEKRGKMYQYSKSNIYYTCPLCGFKHRKRTLNEALRDNELRY